MRIETCKRNSSTEISLSAPRKGQPRILIDVALGQSEVNNKDSSIFFTEHKVAGFDIAVDEAALVHFLYGSKHLD